MTKFLSPICQLLKADVEFQWLPRHEEAFQKLKNIITKAPALTPFDHNKKIILQCDSSKNGIGCCMFQLHDNVLKLVACSSRVLNDCEQNYSQSEKEMLSIYYATQKFNEYIYGRVVDVQTDHKPLISIMNKPVCKIGSVRLQRLKLKLLKYSLNVYYVPGKKLHFADMLSRSTLKYTEYDPEMTETVHLVSKHLPMSEQKKIEFRKETANDKVLNEILKYYHNGWPKERNISPNCKPFYNIRDNIYFEVGIGFLNNKIIVPKNLRIDMVKILHKGHLGINKTIKKARQIFYWPHMSSDIKSYIEQCRTCEKFSPNNYKEKLLPHKIPKLRFNMIGCDILEFGAKSYLVIVDYFSHWIEICLLSDKTSKQVINAMQNIFTRFGYPETIIADNVPFLSKECREYYALKDIAIFTCSPHYHRSNGMAEKAVGISKQILRKAWEEKTDYRELLMEYNNTIIVSLEASPAQILQSRMLRTNLPVTGKTLEPKIQYHIHNKLCIEKEKVKQNHDKRARRKTINYKVGDEVVIKCENEKHWLKGIVTKKAKEPRSYWIKKKNNNEIVRRNTNQMKKSITKNELYQSLEPELYPDTYHNNNNNNIRQHHSRNLNQSINDPNDVNNSNNQNNQCNNQIRSKYGRVVKPTRRLNL